MIVLAYFGSEVASVINKDYEISTTVNELSAFRDNTIYNIPSSQFDFMFSM